MDRPESATKMPEAGKRISPARYCTSTRRPRNAEQRAILYSVSETSSNRVNSTEGPLTHRLWKNWLYASGGKCRKKSVQAKSHDLDCNPSLSCLHRKLP